MNKQKKSKNILKRLSEKGMTLIEIMIVLVILGGILTFIATNVFSKFRKANMQSARIMISEIGKGLDLYYTDCGSYPKSLEALQSNTEGCKNWGPDPYLKKVPKDPWNEEFIYSPKGNSYNLKSLGADKTDGGSGDAADISNDDI